MFRVVDNRDRTTGATNHLFGWMGTICLFAIIPIKLARFAHFPMQELAIRVAPSVLGPAGLLFLLLSSTGRLSRLNLNQMTLLVAALSVALELMQLLPRPRLLAHIRYTFDYYDLGATLLSVAVAYAVSVGILRWPRPVDSRR